MANENHLAEGTIAKGGVNREYQITERPADPPPMRPGTIVNVPRDGLLTPEQARAYYAPPERAGREGDQALPWKGSEGVFAAIRGMLDSRESIGVRRYGRSLETFNGRDAHRDELEEFLDGFVYRQQMRLERAALEAELTRLRAELAQARADLASHVEALDRRCETLKAERDAARFNHAKVMRERDEALAQLGRAG